MTVPQPAIELAAPDGLIAAEEDVVAIAAEEDPSVLREAEEPAALWEGTAEELAAEGPSAALAALRGSVTFLLDPERAAGRDLWGGWALTELPEALVLLSRGLDGPAAAPPDLVAFALDLAVTIRAFTAYYNRDNHNLGRLPEDCGPEGVVFALTQGRRVLMTSEFRAALAECAARLRGPWLAYVGLSDLSSIAEVDPGAFLGELATLDEQFARVAFSAAIGREQVELLRTFLGG